MKKDSNHNLPDLEIFCQGEELLNKAHDVGDQITGRVRHAVYSGRAGADGWIRSGDQSRAHGHSSGRPEEAGPGGASCS